MGYSLIVMGVMAAISIGFAVYASTQAGNAGDVDMSDKFQATYVEDGRCIALIYGKVRVPGNLIWWGELKTKKLDSGGGGKGGGGGGGSTGTRYYCSVWEGIGYGKLTLSEIYINDKLAENGIDNSVWNNGTEATYPLYAGDNANHLPGIAHFSAQNWHIGDNINQIPTIHFVVERELVTPLSYANLSNGSNPASIIYDLLIHIGADAANIDLPSFEIASQRLYAKGYGLNIKFMSQTLKVYDAIKKVLSYFDGILYRDTTGKYILTVFDELDPVMATIPTEEVKNFKGNRKTIQQLPNYFSAKYTNVDEDFVDRTIVLDNLANEKYIGYRRDRASLDLSAYIDETAASKRLWEVMKVESYPSLNIEFITNLKYSTLHAGEIIQISNTNYGIVKAYFRIKSIGFNAENNNDIKITAIEQIERIQDNHYTDLGGTDWIQPGLVPQNLDYVAYYELPHNQTQQDNAAICILAQRKDTYITAAALHSSIYETEGFSNIQDITEFSTRCTVLSFSNEEITLDIASFDPVFSSLEWEQLFISNRILILNEELIGFQNVDYLGGETYKISTLLHNLKGTHENKNIGIGDVCWITKITEGNMIINLSNNNFWIKVVPYFNTNTADISTINAVNIIVENKAKKPRRISYINATRTGSTIQVEIFPSTPGIVGAGDSAPNITDSTPYLFADTLEVTTSHDSNTRNEICSFSFSTALATNISVTSVLNGFRSYTTQLFVGATDGIYKG